MSWTRYFTCHVDYLLSIFCRPPDVHADFWFFVTQSGANHFHLPSQQRCFLLPWCSVAVDSVFLVDPLWTQRSVHCLLALTLQPTHEQCSAAVVVPTLCFSPTHHSLFLLYFHTLSPLICPRVSPSLPAFSFCLVEAYVHCVRTERPTISPSPL